MIKINLWGIYEMGVDAMKKQRVKQPFFEDEVLEDTRLMEQLDTDLDSDAIDSDEYGFLYGYYSEE